MSAADVSDPGDALGGLVFAVVASKSRLKIEATRRAVSMVLPQTGRVADGSLQVTGYHVESEVAAQPWGTEETTTGAWNRLRNLCALNAVKAAHETSVSTTTTSTARGSSARRVFVAMENGLRWTTAATAGEVADAAVLVDFCIAAVRVDDSDASATAESAEVIVPLEIAAELRRRGCPPDITAGQLMHERFGCPADNWHEHVGTLDRVTQMASAVASALRNAGLGS